MLKIGDSKINKSIDTKALMKLQRVFATILKLWLTPRARKLANFQRRKTILELKKSKGEN